MSTVGGATASQYVPLGGNKITVIKKTEDEILGFDGDYKSAAFKYIDFVKDSIGHEIVFSQSDSAMLKKAVDAAYYVFVDKGDVPELVEKYYNQYFRTKQP